MMRMVVIGIMLLLYYYIIMVNNKNNYYRCFGDSAASIYNELAADNNRFDQSQTG